MAAADDPKTRALKRQPLVVASVDGRPLINLTPRVIEALDVHMTGLEFGYVTVRVAHGRVAGFDVMQTHKVIDDLVGQPPRRNAA